MTEMPPSSHIKIARDDHDWLLELGRQEGDSRIMTSTHEVPKSLVDRLRRPLSEGLTLPWAGADEFVRFMPGKVSVWSGPSFSGKTGFLRQLMLHAVTNRHRVLFVSLEEEPEEVWREFMCMAAGTRHPTKDQRAWCVEAWDGSVFVFDSTELIEPQLLMGIIRFAVDRHKLTHVVIDSLMRLNLRTDDFDGQREMGNMLGRLARLSQAHIHLVAHPRKTQNSRTPMDMYDIRGAQDIIAQADLVLTLERQHEEEFDSQLTLWKQRGDVNWIGRFPLYYHKESRQLLLHRVDLPAQYAPQEFRGSA
jgi:KaiC/GvpD/RAD55 family RecA-like ATPase